MEHIILGFILGMLFTSKPSNSSQRFGYAPSPIYSRPATPGLRVPNILSEERLKNVKPPSTGSGIK